MRANQEATAVQNRECFAPRDQLSRRLRPFALMRIQSSQIVSLSWAYALLLPFWVCPNSSPASSMGVPWESSIVASRFRFWCSRKAVISGSSVRPSTPEFTNEVQHFLEEVLPWGGVTSSYPLTIDARLPAYQPMAARSGKSRQLWIARHQQSLGS